MITMGSHRKLAVEDILFVAPYNMQVRRLKQLPSARRIGG
jgi:hypothetical protein